MLSWVSVSVVIGAVFLTGAWSWLWQRAGRKQRLKHAQACLQKYGVCVVPLANDCHRDHLVVIFSDGEAHNAAFCAGCGNQVTGGHKQDFWQILTARIERRGFRAESERQVVREALDEFARNADVWDGDSHQDGQTA